MKRGDLVTIAIGCGLGKSRPALVIQSDYFSAHGSVTVLPLTSTRVDAPLLRVTVQPDADNGLQAVSQVMVDKALTIRRERIGPAFGRLDADTLLQVERCLAVFLGIAK